MGLFLILYQGVQVSKHTIIGDKVDKISVLKHVHEVDFMVMPVLEGCELIENHFS
jgi:hypothetical protein